MMFSIGDLVKVINGNWASIFKIVRIINLSSNKRGYILDFDEYLEPDEDGEEENVRESFKELVWYDYEIESLSGVCWRELCK
jgi:hypothetical protein